MTGSLDIMPKTTEQSSIVCIGESEAKVTNNKEHGRGIVLLKLTADRREASHGLCDSGASCLLNNGSMYFFCCQDFLTDCNI